jgi:DNA-binding beta-propeller fold protein YncE
MRGVGLLLALCGCAIAQTTIAGTGVAGFSGDGGPGVQAQINNPYGLAIGPDGALYFCEIGNHRVRRLDLKSGMISTYAGSGQKGYAGDGGPALSAAMNEPYEVAFDRAGNLYVAEMQNHVVRKVDAKTRTISTVAGTGVAGFGGDGGPAAKAQLRQPHSIAFDPEGRLLICDIGNHRVRRVDVAAGTIETWAGTGERQPTPDGAPVSGTPLNGPRAIAVAPDGQMYLVLREGNAVYRIDPRAGRIYHFAGTGESGHTGDGGPAKQAKLAGPKGISWAPDGSVYLADTESHTIRRIDLKSGIITTVLEDLKRPHGIFVAKDGTVYVADSEKHRLLALKR